MGQERRVSGRPLGAINRGPQFPFQKMGRSQAPGGPRRLAACRCTGPHHPADHGSTMVRPPATFLPGWQCVRSPSAHRPPGITESAQHGGSFFQLILAKAGKLILPSHLQRWTLRPPALTHTCPMRTLPAGPRRVGQKPGPADGCTLPVCFSAGSRADHWGSTSRNLVPRATP